MAKDDDEARCVVMGRKKPSHTWSQDSLIHLTFKKSVAWRSAAGIQRQQRELGEPKYEAVVLLEADFDAGRYKCRLKPPPGFDFKFAEDIVIDRDALQAEMAADHTIQPVPKPVVQPVQEEVEVAKKGKKKAVATPHKSKLAKKKERKVPAVVIKPKKPYVETPDPSKPSIVKETVKKASKPAPLPPNLAALKSKAAPEQAETKPTKTVEQLKEDALNRLLGIEVEG